MRDKNGFDPESATEDDDVMGSGDLYSVLSRCFTYAFNTVNNPVTFSIITIYASELLKTHKFDAEVLEDLKNLNLYNTDEEKVIRVSIPLDESQSVRY